MKIDMLKTDTNWGQHWQVTQALMAAPLLVFVFYIVKLAQLQKAIRATLEIVANVVLSEGEKANEFAQLAYNAPQEALKVANALAEMAVNESIRGVIGSMLTLVTAAESLIVFGFEMTIGTWGCLTISAVNFAANEALNATEAVVNKTNSVTHAVGSDINKGLGKLTSLINGAEGLISTVDEFINGGNADLHSVNLTVSKLDHLNISSDISTKLESLRKDIPTYDGTLSAVKSVISKPFNLIRQQLNTSKMTMNLTLPPIEHTRVMQSPFNGTEVAHDFGRLQNKVDSCFKALFGICAVLIVVGMAFNLWKQHRYWERLQAIANSPRAGLVVGPQTESNSDSKVESLAGPMDDAAAFPNESARLHKHLTVMNQNFATDFIVRHAPIQYWWPAQYAFAKPLVSYFIIGVAGLIISLIELGLINTLEGGAKFVHSLEERTMRDLNANAYQMYAGWENTTNSRIQSAEYQINAQMLEWAHRGSASVNQSISTFMTHINGEINHAFNNTGLLTPMQDVVKCLIGNKVTDIERGLTWVHDHSKVQLPRVPLTLFSNTTTGLSHRATYEASRALQKTVATMRSEIAAQLILFGVILGIWLLFCLTAFICSYHDTNIPKPTGCEEKAKSSSPGPDRFPVVSGPTRVTGPTTGPTTGPKGLTITVPKDTISGPRILSATRSDCTTPLGPPHTPLGGVRNRMTQMFSGPARLMTYSDTQAPQKASIVLSETPRTPLRAMIL